jgi:peptide/nickel transport system ATP-binding protein
MRWAATVPDRSDSSDQAGPAADRPAEVTRRSADSPVLKIDDLVVTYRRHGLVAVGGVSLTVWAGETLGLVGESGSGKSTIGLAAVDLLPSGATMSGRVELCGRPLQALGRAQRREARQRSSMVFQSSSASLDPRRSVAWSIGEPLLARRVPRRERDERVLELLAAVNLSSSMATRLPEELSGGQKQRVGIARALAAAPDLLVCDEPTSALDVSVQASIINLLLDLQQQRRLAMLFISHDMAIVEAVSHRIAVLKDGHQVEEGPAADILRSPRDSYTRQLLDAVPRHTYDRKNQP